MTSAAEMRAEFVEAVTEAKGVESLVLKVVLGDLEKLGRLDVWSQMEWAEDEITKAQKRHPGKAVEIWASFSLLKPNGDKRMATEFVYRAHCAEILDRVASGADTRLGTDSEALCALSEASMSTPLNRSAMGLMYRVWRRRFPEIIEAVGDLTDEYEKLYSRLIDDAEDEARKRLSQSWRKKDHG